MATVFNRIRFLCKTKKMPLASLNDRIEAGRLVAEAYRKQNGEMPEKRVTIAEPERKFNVQWYPTEFIPEIDAIIGNYFNGKNVSQGTSKRKRIPLNRKPVKVN